MRPVKTMKIDPKTGERVTLPMWKYQLEKHGFGLSTKDINELSPEDYAKVKGKPSKYRKSVIKKLLLARN